MQRGAENKRSSSDPHAQLSYVKHMDHVLLVLQTSKKLDACGIYSSLVILRQDHRQSAIRGQLLVPFIFKYALFVRRFDL